MGQIGVVPWDPLILVLAVVFSLFKQYFDTDWAEAGCCAASKHPEM